MALKEMLRFCDSQGRGLNKFYSDQGLRNHHLNISCVNNFTIQFGSMLPSESVLLSKKLQINFGPHSEKDQQ